MGSPVTHATGMLGAVLGPLGRGGDIHLIDRWDPGHALEVMAAYDIGGGTGASIFLATLLDHPDFTPAHAANMERIGLGGAPVPVELGRRAEAARHQDHPRLRLDRAPVDHRQPVRRSGRSTPHHRRARPAGRGAPPRRPRRRRRSGRRTPARSCRAARNCASATPTRRSTTPSTTTAGTTPATSACSTTTAASRSPIA